MWNAVSLVRIWTRVAVSISYDDNHYTTGTSRWKLIYPLKQIQYVDDLSLSIMTKSSGGPDYLQTKLFIYLGFMVYQPL